MSSMTFWIGLPAFLVGCVFLVLSRRLLDRALDHLSEARSILAEAQEFHRRVSEAQVLVLLEAADEWASSTKCPNERILRTPGALSGYSMGIVDSVFWIRDFASRYVESKS